MLFFAELKLRCTNLQTYLTLTYGILDIWLCEPRGATEPSARGQHGHLTGRWQYLASIPPNPYNPFYRFMPVKKMYVMYFKKLKRGETSTNGTILMFHIANHQAI